MFDKHGGAPQPSPVKSQVFLHAVPAFIMFACSRFVLCVCVCVFEFGRSNLAPQLVAAVGHFFRKMALQVIAPGCPLQGQLACKLQ